MAPDIIAAKAFRARPANEMTAVDSERADEDCHSSKRARVAERVDQDISPSSICSQIDSDEIVSLALPLAHNWHPALAQAFCNIRNSFQGPADQVLNSPREGANADGQQNINTNLFHADNETNKSPSLSAVPAAYREIAGSPLQSPRFYQSKDQTSALEPRCPASDNDSEKPFDVSIGFSDSDEDDDSDNAGENCTSLTKSSTDIPLSRLTLKVNFSHNSRF